MPKGGTRAVQLQPGFRARLCVRRAKKAATDQDFRISDKKLLSGSGLRSGSGAVDVPGAGLRGGPEDDLTYIDVGRAGDRIENGVGHILGQ